MIKTIRKFIYEEVLSARHGESEALKTFKSIYLDLYTKNKR